MKLSENWLREWSNPSWDSNQLAEELSLAGLEVDGIEPVAPPFTHVVVGQVLSIEKHPDAEKLNVTQVDVGEAEPLQIVCGARNVFVGMKACCAMVGAELPNDFKIKKAKLRGVPSNGMLCGATEIGLPDDGVDGLHVLPEDAPIGMDIRQYLNLNDTVLEVDLTPNRADCLSVEGIARDVAAVANIAWQQPFANPTLTHQGACSVKISVAEPQACPKYLGCVVTGFDTQAKTPQWMQQRLQRGGLNPKNLMVDVTNYVLLELGQPMHAFDLAKLTGGIQVRFAKDGEKLITLDDKELTLKTNTLVIADDNGPLALAGVMGGLNSAVSDTTNALFFECAHFTPLAVVGKARAYGLHTDSSHRFERGVDAQLPERALARALSLFTEIAGGQISDINAQVSTEFMPKVSTIALRPERIVKLLGATIANETVEAIFKRLGFSVETTQDGWLMTAPSHRFDMTIEADLIEEVGRIYGYNNLPETPLEAPMRLPSLPESEQELHSLKMALVQRGYHEVVTYSFVEENKQKALTPELPYVCLQNPISDDMKAMRTSLFFGFLNTIAYNQNRQQNRVRIFESGLVFINWDKEISQIPVIGGAIVGSKTPNSWAVTEPRVVDFYDLKGDVETLLAMSHLQERVRFVPHEYSVFHPGQSAAIQLDGKTIGLIGQLHPKHAKTSGVSGKVYLFEIRLDALSTKLVPAAESISKFPGLERDLAFVVNGDLPVRDLFDAVESVESDILQSVELFDIYRGQGIDASQKSIALTLKIQHAERTLQDEEVEVLVARIIEAAAQKVHAKLR